MKKLILGSMVFVFSFVFAVSAALAWGRHDSGQTNYAHDVLNYLEASSSTGNNAIGKADIHGNALIDTGHAYSFADGTNAVNSSWSRTFMTRSQKNIANEVSNGVGAYSETGENVIGKADIGGRRTSGSATISAGNSESSASGMNLINTNVEIGGSWR